MLDFIKRKQQTADSHNFIRPQTQRTTTSLADNFSSFNKVVRFCLYALVLVIPFIFLPLTSEMREFTKQNLLFFGIVVMLGAWVVRILTSRKMTWIKTPLDYILLAYLGVYLITSFASIDKVSSFLGYYGRFTGSFISVLSLIALYFLVVSTVRTQKITKRVTDFLTAGIGITLVYSLLQLLGIYILPLQASHDRGFNPIGSLVGLAIFAAVSLVFLQWRWFWDQEKGKFTKISLVVLNIAALVILFLVNAFTAWLVLVLGMIALLALSMNTETNSLWRPMLVLVIGVLFVAFQFLPAVLNPRNLVSINLPVEIQLSNSTTWSLVKNSLSIGSKKAIFGSGPGTTGIAFGQIKPSDLNKTIVWSLNFDRASSEIANIAIESGIVGLLAFELASVLFLIYSLYFLLKRGTHPGWVYALGFFLLWLSLYVTHFFYFFNSTFYFLFWLSIAVFMAIAHWTEQDEESTMMSLASSPRSALSWMFVSLLLLAVLLVGAFFEAAVYGGEVAYTAGINQLNQARPNFAAVANDFGRALTLNPYRDVYYLAYGQDLIFRASEEAAKEKPNTQQIQSWMADTITAGQSATSISPAKASNWSSLAQFYINISPLVSGTNQFVINSWQSAIARDPKNPTLQVQLAQSYSSAASTIDQAIAGTGTDSDQDGLSDTQESKFNCDLKNPDTNGNGVSDGDEVKAGFNCAGTGRLTAAQLAPYMKIDTAMLKSAEDALNKAIVLKPDLPDPYIALARVYEQGNKLEAAKKELDDAAKQFPTNGDILFEQGRITFNQKDYVAAEKIFNTVVALVPNHANALYSLGLIYQQRGDKDKALAAFEKVREITGPNVDLEKLINDLKAAIPPATPTK